jgi:hypothetical protein
MFTNVISNNYNMKTITIICILLLSSLIACEKNESRWEMSPCEFTSEEQLIGLRTPYSFKILDSKTFENLVDTIKEGAIHPKSVKLYNDKLDEINPQPSFWVDNEWVLNNYPPYIDIPFNDDNALLELNKKIFYLTTRNNDTDTIEVYFEKCLVKEVFFNNLDTKRPSSVPTSASFYFKK